MVQAAPHLESLNRRMRRRMDISQGNYDGLDEGRTYYYSAGWQMLEEHVDTDLDDDTDRIGQQFWGVRYVDDAVARRIDRDGDQDFADDAAGYYYLADVMFSVRALTDSEGVLHTRLDYTPYGVAMHGLAADVNGDGVLTFADLTAFSAVYNGGTALRPGDTGYDPDADLSGSGSMGFFDYTAFTGRYGAYAPGGSNPTFNAGWIDNPSDPNGPDNSIRYDGYVFDLAGATESTSTGLYMVRHRVYDPGLGRWLEADPMGLEWVIWHMKATGSPFDSTLFSYSSSNPSRYADPSGLSPIRDFLDIDQMCVSWKQRCKDNSCSPWTPHDDFSHSIPTDQKKALLRLMGGLCSSYTFPAGCAKTNQDCVCWELDRADAAHGPRVGAAMRDCAQAARTAAKFFQGEPRKQNAMQHCYYSCCLTKHANGAVARDILNAHECCTSHAGTYGAKDTLEDMKWNGIGTQLGSLGRDCLTACSRKIE